MYQYKAVLKSTSEVVCEAHNVEELEHLVVHYRRAQKHGAHTRGNEPIEIFHVERNKLSGQHKDKLVKVI